MFMTHTRVCCVLSVSAVSFPITFISISSTAAELLGMFSVCPGAVAMETTVFCTPVLNRRVVLDILDWIASLVVFIKAFPSNLVRSMVDTLVIRSRILFEMVGSIKLVIVLSYRSGLIIELMGKIVKEKIAYQGVASTTARVCRQQTVINGTQQRKSVTMM